VGRCVVSVRRCVVSVRRCVVSDDLPYSVNIRNQWLVDDGPPRGLTPPPLPISPFLIFAVVGLCRGRGGGARALGYSVVDRWIDTHSVKLVYIIYPTE
jgi:hypothetical protein